eukprot:gnl/MRDRNA2_/MRDRNA2_69015_c0_seq1.p1 gnl/MRDRNA2_/MRDRNA2_69015_c0~~gnl/MRDRNA2_/MRDRNA2_69015_c0_seq1.p1  ORF type:complete len:174 (+),score=26.20 gnl/MRDRNA2_/MRDRNA2_69015_c0_seq1:76-597(+)
MSMNGNTIEIQSGVSELTSRIALKKLMSSFGEVEVCHIGNRGKDKPFIRFREPASAEQALQAVKAGQVILEGNLVTADYRGASRGALADDKGGGKGSGKDRSGKDDRLRQREAEGRIPPSPPDKNNIGSRELMGFKNESESRSRSPPRRRSRSRRRRDDRGYRRDDSRSRRRR